MTGESHPSSYSTGFLHNVEGESLPTRAIGRAAMLAGAVHEQGADDIARILQPLDRQQLVELAVALAAMVPIEYSPADLLAWNDRRYGKEPTPEPYQAPLFPVVVVTARTGRQRALRPHGTHAAFNRHKKRGEKPCASCVEGERQFQRDRGPRPARTDVAS